MRHKRGVGQPFPLQSPCRVSLASEVRHCMQPLTTGIVNNVSVESSQNALLGH